MENGVSKEQLIRVIDHTFLKSEKEGVSIHEQEKHVRKLVEEAHRALAFGVCVRESQVHFAKKLITDLGSSLKIVSVIGFPCGDEFSTTAKIELYQKARDEGAHEFDMVFNYHDFLKGQHDKAFHDVFTLSKEIGPYGVLKVIFENTYLPNIKTKEDAYRLVKRAFVESSTPSQNHRRFFKTSTGFAKTHPNGPPIGATLDDIKLMKKVAGDEIGLKPSGGIHSFESAQEFFKVAGATLDPYKFRIGSSTLLSKLV